MTVKTATKSVVKYMEEIRKKHKEKFLFDTLKNPIYTYYNKQV